MGWMKRSTRGEGGEMKEEGEGRKQLQRKIILSEEEEILFLNKYEKNKERKEGEEQYQKNRCEQTYLFP